MCLRPEKSHGDRVLQRTTRRHDLRKDALHSTIRERSGIFLRDAAQDLRLALRPVNRGPVFRFRHTLHDARTRGKQFQKPRIDVVDLLAQAFEFFGH